MPPLALTVMTWVSWGVPLLRDLGGVALPLPALDERNPLVQHFDVVLTGAFFAFALLYRFVYGPGLRRHEIFYASIAIGFVFHGLVCALITGARFEASAAVIASLGRNLIFWAALVLLPWREADDSRVFGIVSVLAGLNVVFVLMQLILIVATRGIQINGDMCLGIFGFANDAALFNLTWAAGLLAAARKRWSRRALGALFFMAGLASAYLTGTAVFLASVPIAWMLARRSLSRRVLVLAAGGAAAAVLAVATVEVGFWLSEEAAESYSEQIQLSPPGFLAGVPLIARQMLSRPETVLWGLGPGMVNSRAVLREGVSRVPELVLPYQDQMAPLTYVQMNQSYLVALAEFGVVGLCLLSAFWFVILRQSAHALRQDPMALSTHEYRLSRLSAVLCLLMLGFVGYGWNESPFAYWTLLSVAPLIARRSTPRTTPRLGIVPSTPRDVPAEA